MKFVQAYGAMFGCDKKKKYVNYPNYDERKSNRGENSLSWSISSSQTNAKAKKQDPTLSKKEDKPSIKTVKATEPLSSPQAKISLYSTLSIIAGQEVNNYNVNVICDRLSSARRNVFMKVLNG